MSGWRQSSALAPFAVRSFRFQWPADLATYWAFEMETLILGWYILVETGSVQTLTLFAALQYVGTLASPMVGVIGDRIGHRNLLAAMRGIYALLATALAACAFTGALAPAIVLTIAGLNGLVRPSDQGVRAALVGETMPPAHLVSAMAISRTTSDTARIAGALAGAGLFVALGIDKAYLAVAAFYAAGCLLTLGIAHTVPARESRAGDAPPSHWSDLRAGLAYVWNAPALQAAMWIAFLVNFTAFPLSNGLLPYVTREIYGADQSVLGYLAASFAVGALAGSVILSLASGRVHAGRMMLLYAAGWYVALLAFAQQADPRAGVATLVAAGFMQSFCLVPLVVLLLRLSGEAFRGRVMGVRMLAINSLPIGLLLAGALIERIGFRATASGYATIGLACTLMIALRWRAWLWPREADANTR